MTHILVARLDRMGDVLICGPAVRAVASSADRVSVLVSPAGAGAAALLPGVDDVLVWECPWITVPPPPVARSEITALVDRLAALGIDEALVLTSFHQSALPTALLLRMAGVARIAAVSEDYPGDLLTARLTDPPDGPEPLRMLAIAEAAGYRLPRGGDARLAVRPVGDPPPGTPDGPFVAVHSGADAPARAYPLERWRETVAELTAAGRTVVITGAAEEVGAAAEVAAAGLAPGRVVDLAGATDTAGLAALLARADVLVAANTGPAHLAAAVSTPVVSLFAPVVPAPRWAPYGVPVALLGDQQAPCRGSRARECGVPGHPCLTGVPAASVRAAVDALAPAVEVAS